MVQVVCFSLWEGREGDKLEAENLKIYPLLRTD